MLAKKLEPEFPWVTHALGIVRQVFQTPSSHRFLSTC